MNSIHSNGRGYYTATRKILEEATLSFWGMPGGAKWKIDKISGVKSSKANYDSRWPSKYNFRNGRRDIWNVLLYESWMEIKGNTSRDSKRRDYWS